MVSGLQWLGVLQYLASFSCFQVRHYIRKTATKSYNHHDLIAARALVKSPANNGRTSIPAAARRFGVPYGTLHDYCNCDVLPKVPGRRTALSFAQERKIVTKCQELAQMFLGIGHTVARSAAYQIAAAEARAPCTLNPFGNGTNLAGVDWFSGLMARHPDLALRLPESTSINRVCALTEEEVTRFHHRLSIVYSLHDFQAVDI
eukprot:GHVU01182267.1.p1 GENE.GHVU01182267.1~~GHVU01182267.1.p1  ORF type:complete len:203 (+),score=4.11 GHVU01182267.1:600-1208(+)